MSAAAKPQPPQLVFDLPHRQARGVEDFLVSGSNSAAVEAIDRWPDWANPAMLVAGPPGSGKTHLAHLWAGRSQGQIVTAQALSEGSVETIAQSGALVVEDVDRGGLDERVLFHLLNLTREKGYALLLTSRQAAGELEIALPDLRSRIRALPMTVIEAPDEALLRAVLVKLFSDRQLEVEPHVVAYLALHMDRSMQAANRVVQEADRLALALQRRVSRTVASEALANVSLAAGETD
jgi:chromosomal replication initiation ATPase DnaA